MEIFESSKIRVNEGLHERGWDVPYPHESHTVPHIFDCDARLSSAWENGRRRGGEEEEWPVVQKEFLRKIHTRSEWRDPI